MITSIVFVGVTAILGAMGYLAARPLVLGYWSRWQRDREQIRAVQQREQRRQALRDEATAGVLRQIARQEETGRNADRRAA